MSNISISTVDNSNTKATSTCAANTISTIATSNTGNLYISPSTSSYTTTLGNWTTIGSTSDFAYYKDSTLENLFLYLKEEEILDIFSKIVERESDSAEIKNIISRVIRSRHFTEDFLLEYISYMEINDILVMHKADIKSGAYPNIALMIEGLK